MSKSRWPETVRHRQIQLNSFLFSFFSVSSVVNLIALSYNSSRMGDEQ
jgi:hypothetical protein